MVRDLILGTAGHIDHGKTTLVRALTGTDTDRLPEEKRRGITIELGFAALDLGSYRLGIVDVPGHERFVRNMLAGATGIDLALLVVAADDSVKPQTREHFDILRLLGLTSGVVALTKCDLADPDWLDLVEEETRELLAGSFMASAPIIRTSATTGQGVEALKDALRQKAEEIAVSAGKGRHIGAFRLPIDRTFTVAGHGTVVTGSVASGEVHIGDELVIQPGDLKVRVRGLQNHDKSVERVTTGQRAAVNLAGVHHDEIDRGHELCSPGHLVPSRWLSVRLELLPSAPRPLKNRTRVRCHVGTAEQMGTVLLLEEDVLQPGQSTLAQLVLQKPAVATWDQGFILRAESPVVTIAGGRVLEPSAKRIRRRENERVDWLRRLESSDPGERTSAALYLQGWNEWRTSDLGRLCGVLDGDQTTQDLEAGGVLHRLPLASGQTRLVHADTLSETIQRVAATLERMHARQSLSTTIDRARLKSQCAYLVDEPALSAVLDHMADRELLRVSSRGVALADHEPRLSKPEQRMYDHIVELYARSRFQPPSVDEVRAEVGKLPEVVSQLVELAADQGLLVQYAPGYFLHADAERELREILNSQLATGDGLTVSEIRQLLDTSRKYAVPICEYLDRIGFTRLVGDRRMLCSPAAGVATGEDSSQS